MSHFGKSENVIHEGAKSLAKLVQELIKERKESVVIGFDGFPKVNWEIVPDVRELLAKDMETELVNGFSIYKSPEEIWEIIQPNLTMDEYFGRVFQGSIEDFLAEKNILELKQKIQGLKEKRDSIICFGPGISSDKRISRELDVLFYLDIGKRKVLDRMNGELPWFVPKEATFGEQIADVGLSLQSFKLSQYIFPPVFEKSREKTLQEMDYYIDVNTPTNPKTVSQDNLSEISSSLVRAPITFDPIYVPSPWGGQWIRKREKLSKEDYPNCAWKFEVILPEMNVLAELNGKLLTLPGSTLLSLRRQEILGEKSSNNVAHRFPIRVHYDDNWDGGNMAIQVHPDKNYANRYFAETTGQHEAYYILDSQSDSKVYLGLKEDVDLDEFYREAQRTENEGITLNYGHYLKSFTSKQGDLFLIPAGTIHALGKGNVCLEIGIGWGYTFHVYDYLRPDMEGNLRPIHLNHAFSAIDGDRRGSYVKKNLREDPKIIRQESGFVEYKLGNHAEIPWEVRRIDLEDEAKQSLEDGFHILALVKGNSTIIKLNGGEHKLNYTQTALLPATVDNYHLENNRSTKARLIKLLIS